jgi:amino acid permease
MATAEDLAAYRELHNASPKTDFVPLECKNKNTMNDARKGYKPVDSECDGDAEDPMAPASSEVEITSTSLRPIHQEENTENDILDISDRISWFDACMHLIKGNLGPGCLNIPHAFVLSGWLLGLGLFSLVVFQGIYSMYILVYCKSLLQRHQTSVRGQNSNPHADVHTFMDVAYAAFGQSGKWIIELFLVVLQMGVCCVFLSLLATNLRAAFPILHAELCIGIITLALLAVVLLQRLKDLRWLSTTANAFMMTAIFTAAGTAIHELMHPSAERPPPTKYTDSLSDIATFVSSMFFSFEGIGLVLPIENSYVGLGRGNDNGHNRRYKSFKTYILTGSMSVVAMLFLIIGITSSLAFTDIQSGSITAYLTETFPHNVWFQVCNTLVMVAVFLTFPLQLTPAMEVLDDWFGPGCDPRCIGGSGGCCHALLMVRRRRQRQSDVSIGAQNDTFRDESTNTPNGVSDTNNGDEVMREGATTKSGFVNGNNLPPMDDSGIGTGQNAATSSSTAPSPWILTDDDNGQEILIAHPPSFLNNSCFGEHEWIFRRYIVVFGCALVVLVVNDLALLMSLFGAVGQTGLALMPCAIHLKLQQMDMAPRRIILSCVDGCTIVFSLLVMVTGVTFSIKEILLGLDNGNRG